MHSNTMWPFKGVLLAVALAAAALVDGDVAKSANVEVMTRVVVLAARSLAAGAPEKRMSRPSALEGLGPTGDTKIELNGALFTGFNEQLFNCCCGRAYFRGQECFQRQQCLRQ